MNKRDKIQLGCIGALGMYSLIQTFRLSYYRTQTYDLKIDNVNLLEKSFIAMHHLSRGEKVPEPVLMDMEFRRAAFFLEYGEGDEED